LSAQLDSEGKKFGLVTVDEAFDLVHGSRRGDNGLGADMKELDCKLGCAITISEGAQCATILEAKGENHKNGTGGDE
jgi:hypothetical protein